MIEIWSNVVMKVYQWGTSIFHKKDFDVTAYNYKVHGHPFSPNTRRVLAALHEKGIDFEAITVELKDGEQKKEPFIHLNPFGQVPVFEDGNLVLCQSRAITQYVSYVHMAQGTPLLTLANHKTMGILTMWMEIEAQQFDPPASKLTWELVIKPIYGLPTDNEVVKENKQKLATVLDVYEAQLESSTYISGERFTLADLHHLPNLEHLFEHTVTKPLFTARPNVHNWVTRIRERDSWKKARDPENWFKRVKDDK